MDGSEKTKFDHLAVYIWQGIFKGITPADVKKNKDLAIHFWKHVQMIKSFGAQRRSKTVAAQPVVLRPRKIDFELSGAGKPTKRDDVALKQLWAALKSGKLDFSCKNDVWRSLMLSPEQRNSEFPGMCDFVHVALGTVWMPELLTPRMAG